MRRGRIFIFLALILIIGLAVVALVFRQFLGGGGWAPAAEAQPTTVPIYFAGQNIPQGLEITEEVLATLDIPQDKVVSVMFTVDEKDELVGTFAKYPIDQGVLITSTMVSKEELTLIPQGMTAIAIPTTRLESVAYGVRDGAHVNVSA